MISVLIIAGVTTDGPEEVTSSSLLTYSEQSSYGIGVDFLGILFFGDLSGVVLFIDYFFLEVLSPMVIYLKIQSCRHTPAVVKGAW